MSPIVTLITLILSIYFVFYLIRPIDFTKLMPNNPVQASILKVVVATSIGFLLATALITLMTSALQIPNSILKDL